MSDKKMPPGPRPVDPVFLAQIAATLMGSGGHNVKTAVAKASALVPRPADGRDGRDGAPGVPGRDGADGLAGEKGLDGRDGLGVEDLQVDAVDGGREIVVGLRAGDRLITRTVRTALVIDRGVWKSDAEYSAGDGVTYGGSVWFAQVDTKESPGDSRDGMPWRMAVRRPKDAKGTQP